MFHPNSDTGGHKLHFYPVNSRPDARHPRSEEGNEWGCGAGTTPDGGAERALTEAMGDPGKKQVSLRRYAHIETGVAASWAREG